jgi:hypothetical protein
MGRGVQSIDPRPTRDGLGIGLAGQQSLPTFEAYLRKSVVDKKTLDVFLSPKELSWAKFDPVTGYRLGNYLPRDGINGSSTIFTTPGHPQHQPVKLLRLLDVSDRKDDTKQPRHVILLGSAR